jgi:CHAT domain-containing protein
VTRIVSGLGCTLLVCLGALALPGLGIAQEEKSFLGDWINQLTEWQGKVVDASAADLAKAEAQLREVRPLLEAQISEGDNNYKEALETLTGRAAELDKRLNHGSLSNPTVLDGMALLELARLYSLTGRHDLARQRAELGLKVQVAVTAKAPSHREALLLQARLTVATVLARGGRPYEAVPFATEALNAVRAPTRSLLAVEPNLPVIPCLLLRSELHQAVGEYAAALATADEALRLWRPKQSAVKDVPGDLTLGGILQRKGAVLVLLGRGSEAWPLLEESLTVVRAHCAEGHPLLGVGHATLANVALLHGDSLRAHGHVNESLREFDRCFPEKHFPNGTPFVLRARNCLGELLCQLGAPRKALELYQETQKKCAGLYGKEPHADQLETMLACVTAARLADEEALACRLATEAVDLARRLYPAIPYPRGHRNLALARLQLASVQVALDRQDYQENLDAADAMYRRLYPEGHPDCSALLLTQAAAALKKQDYAQAHKLFRLLLGAQEEEARRFGVLASAAEALAFARQRQTVLSWLLACSRHLPEQRGEDYEAVWACKSLATRLLRERLRAYHLVRTNSPEAQKVGNQLIECYQQINHCLLGLGMSDRKRDAELQRLYDEVRRLEGERNKYLPPAIQERTAGLAGPGALAQALPKDVAFVDIVRYEDFSVRPATSWYVAFVLTPDAAPRYVDLGSAELIDPEVRGWREAVDNWFPQQTPAHERDQQAALADTRRHGEKLRDLVWRRITEALPRTIRTFYLAPDGDLAGLTFAALPTAQGDRILLEEDLLIGYVPHGPFLLEQLTFPAAEVRPSDSLLLVGDVDFGRAPDGVRPRFSPLSSGAKMIGRFRELDPNHLLEPLEGNKATLAQFRQAMAEARLAYVATHGFFDKEGWELEQKSWDQALKGFQPGGLLPLVGLGRRSPMSYTGLALSMGNRLQPTEPGIVTGDMIAELRLENLKLAVLCSCETGLGKYVAGEGVQALLRAFHIAGCPRVVASLWGGYIHPTDAILERFTRDVWKEGKAPLVALRDAQREVYYHPESVRFIAASPDKPVRYGSGDDRTIRATSTDEKTPPEFKPGSPRAAVKVWGAHILSGVGH